jgi:hypothetical protein
MRASAPGAIHMQPPPPQKRHRVCQFVIGINPQRAIGLDGVLVVGRHLANVVPVEQGGGHQSPQSCPATNERHYLHGRGLATAAMTTHPLRWDVSLPENGLVRQWLAGCASVASSIAIDGEGAPAR